MITIQKSRSRVPIVRGQLSSYGGEMHNGKWVHTFSVTDPGNGVTVEVLIDGSTFKELIEGWEHQ